MNILEEFDSYRESQKSKMIELLSKVAKSILKETEKIPKEILTQNFKENSSRFCLDCNLKQKGEKNIIEFEFADGSMVDEVQYDMKDIKALNDFLAEYYPGISVRNYVCLYLEAKFVRFSFNYNGGFEKDDFDFFPDIRGFVLKKENWDKDKSSEVIDIFNSDMEFFLNQSFGIDDWDDLCNYYFEQDGKKYDTSTLAEGYVSIEIPLKMLL